MSSNNSNLSYKNKFEQSSTNIHPSWITAGGNLSHILGALCMLDEVTLPFAPMFISLGIFGDFKDGKHSRKYGLTTIEGANSDPLADKLGHLPQALIIANYALNNGNDLTAYLISGTIATNIVTQAMRPGFFTGKQFKEYKNAVFKPLEQTLDLEDTKDKANLFGKVKAATQSISNGVYSIYMGLSAYNILDSNEKYLDLFMDYAMPSALAFCVASASCNILSRLIPKKSLESILSFDKN